MCCRLRARWRVRHADALTSEPPLSTLLTNRPCLPRGRRLFRITGLPHWTRNKHAART
ncbi:MAG: hypothetical protein PCALPYG08_3671 [uncultured Paraburkholderia sp.]|nr:MAG: hypothetical protein PCALPYG08_3671 [uncultured Paraburkholderia sp.]